MFKFMLGCRASEPFEGYVTLYGLDPDGAVNYSNVIASWTCSDQNRTVHAELTVQVNDWSPSAGFGLLEVPGSTAFAWPFGGCSWGLGPQSLETPLQPGGAVRSSTVVLRSRRNEPNKDVWMQVLLFSAGDQPGSLGRPSS